jgi:hypothetical protein
LSRISLHWIIEVNKRLLWLIFGRGSAPATDALYDHLSVSQMASSGVEEGGDFEISCLELKALRPGILEVLANIQNRRDCQPSLEARAPALQLGRGGTLF